MFGHRVSERHGLEFCMNDRCVFFEYNPVACMDDNGFYRVLSRVRPLVHSGVLLHHASRTTGMDWITLHDPTLSNGRIVKDSRVRLVSQFGASHWHHPYAKCCQSHRHPRDTVGPSKPIHSNLKRHTALIESCY